MVFLNLVVFANWPLTATLAHSILLSLHAVFATPLLRMAIATAMPRRKHTAEPISSLVSSADLNFCRSVWCLNSAVSFS